MRQLVVGDCVRLLNDVPWLFRGEVGVVKSIGHDPERYEVQFQSSLDSEYGIRMILPDDWVEVCLSEKEAIVR